MDNIMLPNKHSVDLQLGQCCLQIGKISRSAHHTRRFVLPRRV